MFSYPYLQIELYEACKSRDTIVFLRPGNGKHFITVMLVKFFAPKALAVEGAAQTQAPSSGSIPRSTETRKVFFLTKSVNSIRLYASVFRAHTDCRMHEHYVEDSDRGGKVPWSSEEWRSLMTTNDIHLMLDATFEALLAAGFVTADHVQLLILDDVHRIIVSSDGDDCYTKVVKKLRAGGLKR